MVERGPSGRDAFAGQRWADAYAQLAGTSRESMGAPELEQLAVAAYLLGDDDTSVTAWEEAHDLHLRAGDGADAARCAFWLALGWMLRGQMAHAGAWLGRTATLAEDQDCAATGYLLIPALLGALDANEADTARELAVRAAEVAERFDDRDLAALAGLGLGQALVALGQTAVGLGRFDEVMLSVASGDIGPVTSGIVYCAVILECMHLLDLARAAEWTDALHSWCDSQPGMVPFRGQCLVHRSQLQQAAGDWSTAMITVESARQRLSEPPHPALGLAHYQQAELNRLAGRFDTASAAYAQASRSGYQPMPGLALLELARGDTEAAAASIRRALQETVRPVLKAPLLAAAVEILAAAGDREALRAVADELQTVAVHASSDVLTAMAEHSSGAAWLELGDPSAALGHLRAAGATWLRLRMPYEAARTTVLVGLACSALGDRTSATVEFANALEAFRQLGAGPDCDRVQAFADRLTRGVGEASGHPGAPALSSREREVLAHVAAGETNREIAAALSISQHTVGRHLENIFVKLGVTGRAAATAYAYEHHLL